MKNKIKFVFFGTGKFAVEILETLKEKNMMPDLIVNTPDKPSGRKMEIVPTPVKVWARENNKVVIQPEKLTEIRELLSTYFDLFIVAEYGKIIPIHIINIPKFGTINVHPSLLPKFRGPSPVRSFILSGEKETGITIMLIDQEVDHGPIIAQEKLSEDADKMGYPELTKKLARLGGDILATTIPQLIEGKSQPKEQDHNQATFTKKTTKEDGLLKPDDAPETIDRKFRALTPWPGIYFFTDGKRVIITDAEMRNGKLAIKKVKPEGKNEMPLEDFLRGNANAVKDFPYLSINGTNANPA